MKAVVLNMAFCPIFPDYSDLDGVLDFFIGLRNRNLKESLKGKPKWVKIKNQHKKRLYVQIFDKTEALNIASIFPFPHFDVMGYCYCNKESISGLEIKTDFDKILIMSFDPPQWIIEKMKDEMLISSSNIITIHNCDGRIYARFGEMNKGITINVMIPNPMNGILWVKTAVSREIRIKKLCNVVVDLQNYINCTVSPSTIGLYNSWNYFFRKNSLSLNEVYDSENVYLNSTQSTTFANPFDKDELSIFVIRRYKRQKKKLYGRRKKVLGVFLRGTDYHMAPLHYAPYDPYEAIEYIGSNLKFQEYNYIFLDTEDEWNYTVFKEYYGDRLICMNRQRYTEDGKEYISQILLKSGVYNNLLACLDYIIETLLVSAADCVISSPGTSSIIIQNLRNGLLYKEVLRKHINCINGSVPLIVESHTKNVFDTPINYCVYINGINIITSGERHIRITGKSIGCGSYRVINCNCCMTELNTYISSIVGTKEEDLDVFLEYIDESGQSVFSEIGQSIESSLRIVEANVWIKVVGNQTYNSDFMIQVEKGNMASEYVPYRYSTTQMPVQDDRGLIYNLERINMIDFDRGLFTVGGTTLSLSKKTIETYRSIIRYSRGYDVFVVKEKKYLELSHLSDDVAKLSDCTDYQWVMHRIETMPSWRNRLIIPMVKSYIYSDDRDVMRQGFQLALIAMKKVPSDALLLIGICYRDGCVVCKNLIIAEKLIKKAVDMGSLQAKWEYFGILWQINTPEALKTMIEYAEEESAKGNMELRARLGRAYRDGRGVQKDLRKAADLMKETHGGNPQWSKWEYVDILWNMNTPETDKEMVDFLSSELESTSNKELNARLARCYREGRGVNKDDGKSSSIGLFINT